MSIITSHNVTLFGGYGSEIILRPLTDEHLPLLCKWNADPEVLYWTEGGTNDATLSYGPETVHQIYGGVSKNALCFIVEVAGVAVGECWIQRMNLPQVKAMYPEYLDVRRIDMAIGEKEYWNKGIGTEFVGMLVNYAFNGENVDVLHCFCEDYNHRSRRMWEKQGFARVLEEPLLPQPQKGQWQYHYRLTRQQFISRRRLQIPLEKCFLMPIAGLQPSQLYISEGKLRLAREWFSPQPPNALNGFDPIPIIRLNGGIAMSDGHTRAVMAHLAGWQSVPAYWDDDPFDLNLYSAFIEQCRAQNVLSPIDLAARIVPHDRYQHLWLKFCMKMTVR